MRWRGFLRPGSSSRLLALKVVFLLALAPALAQGLPGLREGSLEEAYWFIANRTQEVLVVGLPPEPLVKALEGKRLTLLLGSEKPPAWARDARVVRLGGSPMGGFLLLADGRYFVAQRDPKTWVMLENPQVVAVLWGYFSLALQAGR